MEVMPIEPEVLPSKAPARAFAHYFSQVSSRGKIGDSDAVVDRFAFGFFGGGFLLGERQHLGGASARDKAHAGVVGEHDIARRHAHAGNNHLAVDLDGFDAPLAGDRSDFRGPDWVADPARMTDVAHAAEHDGAGFALALAGLRRDASHVRDAGDAVDDDDVARQRQIMRFELGHLVHVPARGFIDMLALENIAHRERRPDDA